MNLLRETGTTVVRMLETLLTRHMFHSSFSCPHDARSVFVQVSSGPTHGGQALDLDQTPYSAPVTPSNNQRLMISKFPHIMLR